MSSFRHSSIQIRMPSLQHVYRVIVALFSLAEEATVVTLVFLSVFVAVVVFVIGIIIFVVAAAATVAEAAVSSL